MEPHSGILRTRLAALVAAGLALPVAVLLVAGLVSFGGEEPEDCVPEAVRPDPSEVAEVAAGLDPLPWALYTNAVSAKRLRHNQLHGGVVVQYGERAPAVAVEMLVEWYRDDPVGLVVAPRPELGSAVRASAWAGSLGCSRFDLRAFVTFETPIASRGPNGSPRGSCGPAPPRR